MRSFTFNTGRQYTPEGQIIHVVADDAGFVSFYDESRLIVGCCSILVEVIDEERYTDLQGHVMDCYDRQLYTYTMPADHRAALHAMAGAA